ncbi:hypothetical protein FOA52_000838 [Chlamydomonas sp. UWO 241]|nr:hypothetical protein FOA52_000838 [Chlamydomonas sp. UWO 241]
MAEPERPGGARMVAALLYAMRDLARQSGGSRDLAPYVDMVEGLLGDQVCPRCILRLFRHTRYDDYAAQPPSCPGDLMDGLRRAAAAADVQAPAAASQGGQPSGQQKCEGAGAGGGAGGGSTEAAASSSKADGAAAAAWPATCSLCLGVMQMLPRAAPGDTAPLAIPTPADPPLGAPTAASLSPHPSAAVVLSGASTLRADGLARVLSECGVPFVSFDVDVCLCASALLRERMVTEHMGAKWKALGHKGPPQAVPIKQVVQRLLGPALALQLGAGKKLQDGSVDITLTLTMECDRDREELRPLVKELVEFQHRRKQGVPNPHVVHQQSRKKQKRAAAEAVIAAAAAQAEAAAAVAAGTAEEVAAAAAAAAVAAAAAAAEDAAAVQLEATATLASMSTAELCALVGQKPAGVLRRVCPWPPTSGAMAAPAAAARVVAGITRANAFLAGRYMKVVRGMPQSRWFDLDTGERIGCVSLGERILEVLAPMYNGSDYKFITGGREDADVRMLGDGRPFVFEVTAPQLPDPSAEQLRAAEAALARSEHGARAVSLTTCTRAACDKIKEAEESKEKTYSALCWAERPLSAEAVGKLLEVRQLDVAQDTPLRVLHRRAPKVRTRWVTVEAVEPVPSRPCYFNLRLRTQAGTYVKEFCHGDLGRTTPNLGTLLGCRTEILQLDVLEVHMPDWP